MEDPEPPIQPKPRKSNSLFTSIIIILTLILLSMFPSQPPEFIKQTLFSNLWGLIHLLFIGITVSYGLFSRRRTGIEPKIDANERYFSGHLQFSSIFDNGLENFNGCDEKLIVDSWKWSPIFDKWENPRFGIQSKSDGELTAVVAGDKCDHDKPLNLPIRSLRSKIVGNSYAESLQEMGTNLLSERFCLTNMNQTQNYDCPYINGESTDVVAHEKCDLENWGNLKLVDDYKPLNLPVRSIRSKVVENSNAECVHETGTNLVSGRFSEKNDKIKKGAIRGLVPINLEKKFEEVTTSPSSKPWSSRSRTEISKKSNPPSHTRLLSEGVYEFDKMRLKGGRNQMGEDVFGFSSLGDFGFEKLNSQSKSDSMKVGENNQVNQNMGKGKALTHSRALSGNGYNYTKVEKFSQTKVRDEKRNAKSPPCVRPSGEFGNNGKKLELKTKFMETIGKESDIKSLSQSESFWASIYSPINSVSPSPNKPSPLSAISTDEQNPNFDDLKRKESFFSSISTINKKISIGSTSEMNLDGNDSNLKTLNKSMKEENRENMKLAAPNKSSTRGKSVRTIRTNKSFLVNENKEKNSSELMDEKLEKLKSFNLENVSSEKSSNFCEYRNEEKQKFCGSDKAQAGKGLANPGEKADSATVDDELDSDEVDKKADAFIAKFREQIRLQKIDSIERKRC